MYTLTNNGKTKEDQKKEVGGSEEQPGEEVPHEPQGEQPPKKLIFQRLGENTDNNGRQEHYPRLQEKGKPELSIDTQKHQEDLTKKMTMENPSLKKTDPITGGQDHQITKE